MMKYCFLGYNSRCECCVALNFLCIFLFSSKYCDHHPEIMDEKYCSSSMYRFRKVHISKQPAALRPQPLLSLANLLLLLLPGFLDLVQLWVPAAFMRFLQVPLGSFRFLLVPSGSFRFQVPITPSKFIQNFLDAIILKDFQSCFLLYYVPCHSLVVLCFLIAFFLRYYLHIMAKGHTQNVVVVVGLT